MMKVMSEGHKRELTQQCQLGEEQELGKTSWRR